MASLENVAVKDSYTSLLKLNGNTDTLVAGNNSNAIQVVDGDGTASPLYLNTDRLGIGGQPSVPMHIYANDTTKWQSTIEQDGTGDAALKFSLTGARDWLMGLDNSDSDKFKIGYDANDLNDLNVLTLDTSGNVGIGLSVPTAPLHVKGANDSYVQLWNNHSDVNIGGMYNNVGHGVLQVKNSSGATKVNLNSDSDSYFTGGSLGIGTASPDTNMHIHKATAGSVDSNANAQLTIENNTHAGIQFLTPNDANNIIYFGDVDDNDVSYLAYLHSSNEFEAFINGGVRLKLDANSRISLSNNDGDAGNCTFFGYLTGATNGGGGDRNSAFGHQALTANSAGDDNTVYGHQAGLVAGTSAAAINNTLIGSGSGKAIDQGDYNTCLGYYSGDTITTGEFNVVIGNSTDVSASGATSQVVIGAGVVGNQDYGTVIGNTSMFQFASKQYTAHYADGEDLKSASAGAGLKLPAYSIIKSISVVVTQLSNLGTYNICLVLADDSSGVADNSAFTNPVEVLGAGVTATLSGNSSSAVDIALGSGAVVKQSYHMDEAINVGTSDKYLHLAQAGTGNGDTNPSTNGLLNIIVEYIGLD